MRLGAATGNFVVVGILIKQTVQTDDTIDSAIDFLSKTNALSRFRGQSVYLHKRYSPYELKFSTPLLLSICSILKTHSFWLRCS